MPTRPQKRRVYAGLPVLRSGEGLWAGRVAALRCRASGLAELVTHDLEAYEALCACLTLDYPDRLDLSWRRCAATRLTCHLRYRLAFGGTSNASLRVIGTSGRAAAGQGFAVPTNQTPLIRLRNLGGRPRPESPRTFIAQDTSCILGFASSWQLSENLIFHRCFMRDWRRLSIVR